MRFFSFFFFNDTATTEIYTLSLHDALPISLIKQAELESWPYAYWLCQLAVCCSSYTRDFVLIPDRKSTRLNSSHGYISYAVFCLKKKKKNRLRVLGPQARRRPPRDICESLH